MDQGDPVPKNVDEAIALKKKQLAAVKAVATELKAPVGLTSTYSQYDYTATLRVNKKEPESGFKEAWKTQRGGV